MHDVLAHRLSLLATYAGALEYRPDAPPEKVAHAAGVVRAGVHQALDELRDVIGVLRYEPPGPSAGATAHGADSPVPGPRPGLDQLDALVAETRAAGSVVELVRDVPHGLPGLTGRTAYRVVQEGLTNARKHAAGHPVTVRVDGRRGAGLTVRVTNPVAAAPATVPGSSTGLIGLEERVRIVGGRLEHGTDGGQFRLQAWLPWQP
jgi:signal transduction histidine kinase